MNKLIHDLLESYYNSINKKKFNLICDVTSSSNSHK